MYYRGEATASGAGTFSSVPDESPDDAGTELTGDSYEAGMEARGESIPVGRVGDPMELGDTVAYLCSDRAGYINGESVVVDGGSTKSTL